MRILESHTLGGSKLGPGICCQAVVAGGSGQEIWTETDL